MKMLGFVCLFACLVAPPSGLAQNLLGKSVVIRIDRAKSRACKNMAEVTGESHPDLLFELSLQGPGATATSPIGRSDSDPAPGVFKGTDSAGRTYYVVPAAFLVQNSSFQSPVRLKAAFFDWDPLLNDPVDTGSVDLNPLHGLKQDPKDPAYGAVHDDFLLEVRELKLEDQLERGFFAKLVPETKATRQYAFEVERKTGRSADFYRLEAIRHALGSSVRATLGFDSLRVPFYPKGCAGESGLLTVMLGPTDGVDLAETRAQLSALHTTIEKIALPDSPWFEVETREDIIAGRRAVAKSFLDAVSYEAAEFNTAIAASRPLDPRAEIVLKFATEKPTSPEGDAAWFVIRTKTSDVAFFTLPLSFFESWAAVSGQTHSERVLETAKAMYQVIAAQESKRGNTPHANYVLRSLRGPIERHVGNMVVERVVRGKIWVEKDGETVWKNTPRDLEVADFEYEVRVMAGLVNKINEIVERK